VNKNSIITKSVSQSMEVNMSAIFIF